MILQTSRQVCYYCGKYITPTGRTMKGGVMSKIRNREHIIPKSQGGNNRAENRLWTCCKCNSRRGTMPHEEYLETMCRDDGEKSRVALLLLYIAYMGERLTTTHLQQLPEEDAQKGAHIIQPVDGLEVHTGNTLTNITA